MRVLLDTCLVSELWRKGGSEKVRKHVSELRPNDTFLSVLTVGERRYFFCLEEEEDTFKRVPLHLREPQ